MARRITVDATLHGTAAAPRLSSVIVAATIGNVLEWFDFLVYGFFAVTLAEVFFPAGNPTVSLLITFGAFGLSYVVRPLGAIVIGGYTDRAGRKAGLTLSIALMMIGTTLMVVTPGYATIGIAAPILITIARLLQGFSVGGEFGSAVSFSRRARRRSQGLQRQLAVGQHRYHLGHRLALRRRPDDAADAPAAGRLGMAHPLCLRPAGWPRRSLHPLAHGRDAGVPRSRQAADRCRSANCCAAIRSPVLLALGISIISNSSYYLLLYIPTYGVKTLHLPAYTGFVATLLGGVVLAIFSVIAGHWSDKTARPRIMLVMAWLFAIAAYPAF